MRFFSYLGREFRGYLSFFFAYVLIIAFGIAVVMHLDPAVSIFSPNFGNEANWLARLIPPDAWNGWGQIFFSLTSYKLVILPGLLLLILVLARCYADDAHAEAARPGEAGPGLAAMLAKFIGTLVMMVLLWAPGVGASYFMKRLVGYDLRQLWIEIGAIALGAALLRTLCTRGFRTLFTREVKANFYSPIGYVVICFMLIATGFVFFSGVSFLNQRPTEVTVVEASFNTILFWIATLLVFPLVTMRTYADEFRMGTFEMMTTAPVHDWEVVAAKFCGALFFYCLLWLPSASYFIAFQLITGKAAALAAGAYGGAYLMLFLLGMFYLSIGCLCSSLTKEQINALVMSFVIIFGLFVTGLIGMIMNISMPEFRSLISYFSAVEHMGDFSRGLIDTRHIIFYLSMTAFVLFLNFQVYRFRKWRA